MKLRLEQYRRKFLFRQRYVNRKHTSNSVVSFASSDYLSLKHYPDILRAFHLGIERYGFGSGASPLVAGFYDVHDECERAFADFMERDRALLFSSGYLANLAVVSALTTKDDAVFVDKQVHASVYDGLKLSEATVCRYAHHKLQQLSYLLEKHHAKNKFIITDGVFSMDGSLACLPEIAKMAKQHQATLIVDDAHALAVFGEKGCGTSEWFQLSQTDVPLIICPLGKAFAASGAFVVGQSEWIEGLIQFARPYMYSTAVIPAVATAILATLDVVCGESWRRDRLHELIRFFKKVASENHLSFLDSMSAIQCFVVGSASRAVAFQQALLQRGFYVAMIRPPTVAVNQCLLRISLNCCHEESDIKKLIESIAEINHALR